MMDELRMCAESLPALDLTSYTIRRKVFKLFGASFQIFDPDGAMVGYSKQKAFKLKEDIRVFTSESMETELLVIQARQIIDFSAAYDIIDGQGGTKIGAARRKGLSSLVRDSWEILSVDDRPIARLSEDSLTLAMVRRMVGGILEFPSLIPQRYHLSSNGQTE